MPKGFYRVPDIQFAPEKMQQASMMSILELPANLPWVNVTSTLSA